jgi:hypothetical protein
MPWALLKCEDCGRFYRHYPVGEVERWINKGMNPSLRSDKAHFARQVKKLEALCPYCREALNGMPYFPSRTKCRICNRDAGRDKHGNCRFCGGPLGVLVSKTFSRRKR